jgi:hypothetical protein
VTDTAAARLVGALGPTVVAALTGAGTVAVVQSWCQPNGPQPDDDAAMRLAFALAAWTAISDEEGDDIARAWFVGGNPTLGEDTPITALREDRVDEFLTAAASVLEGARVDGGHEKVLVALIRSIRELDQARDKGEEQPARGDPADRAASDEAAGEKSPTVPPTLAIGDPNRPAPYLVWIKSEGDRYLATVPALEGASISAESLKELSDAVREMFVAAGLPRDARIGFNWQRRPLKPRT